MNKSSGAPHYRAFINQRSGPVKAASKQEKLENSMHLKWKNAFSRVSIAVFLAATSLYAIPRGPCDIPPPPVCCEEPKPGPFAFAYPFDMDLNCPRDFYINASFLAMQAKQDGMEFVIQDTNGAPNNGITNGKFEGFSDNHEDWKYNFGLRVGVGFYLNHDAWNLDFTWTWLNISDNQQANATTSGGFVIPLWLLGEDTDGNFIGQRSGAVWDASYNTFDARIGKPYYVSRYFIVNPHFGIRAAWIDQHFSVDYSGLVGPTPSGFPDNTVFAGKNRIVHHGDNDFWGIGTRAGVDTDWLFGKGFGLFGNIAASILYGKFDIEQHLTTPPTLQHPQNVGFDIEDDHYMNVPNFEMALGLGWGRYFNKMKYHVGVKAAYEFHVWFDQFNLRRFWGIGQFNTNPPGGPTTGQIGNYPNDVVSRGNLTLNGFSLKVQFDM